jgi:uncharacterized protein involved in exopolysaccharide biosynthesis
MVEQDPNIGAGRDASNEDEPEGIDLERVREMAGFALRAARRRPKLASMTFVTVAALGVTVAATMPRTYTAQVKLLAQRSSAIRMLSGSNPAMDSVDNPTKNVAAMIMRRDNVVALVNDANLVRRFEETRPPPLKLKDHVMAQLFGPPSDEDQRLNMVYTLEKKLDVVTDESTSTVVITVDWSIPQIAYDLVMLVQKNFLEARYDSDVAVINDSIAVLQEHAKTELTNVDVELDAYQKLVAARTVKTAVVPAIAARGFQWAPRPAAGAPSSEPVDPDLTKALEEKRVQIRALEEARQRTLETLRQQLVQAQLTLTPMHPSVIALQQKVESMSQPLPELAQLRNEERSLMAQIAPPRPAAAASAASPTTPALPFLGGPPAVDAGAAALGTLPAVALERDGTLQLAQSKLAGAIRAYEDAMARIDAAKVELDITEAAYKHRYTVVSPAELPKKPKKATARLVGAASVLGAVLLAVLLAAGLDVLAGLILETWQVRRGLKLEVLGELEQPSSPTAASHPPR